MALPSQNLQATLEQGISAQQRGDLESAQQAYESVIASFPLHAVALHNLGVVNMHQGELSSAVRRISLAMQIAPEEPVFTETRRNLALTLYRYGLWEDAISWIELALEDSPSDQELQAILLRIRPREYLAAEVYSPAQDEVLKRFSPRECESYLYVIDIVGTCNLRCPSCPVGNFTAAQRPKGFMEFALYEQILRKIEQEKVCSNPELWLFNWGEPLLHPELPRFITAANEFGLPVSLSSNLNIKTDLTDMVRANPKSLKVSLSGFSPQTYSLTHTRGKLDMVVNNLRRLREIMSAENSSMQVFVSQHLYRHNAHESESVSKLCAELDFHYAPVQAFFQPLEKVKEAIDGTLTARELPVLELLQLHPRERRDKLQQTRTGEFDCELRFNQTVINHDGSVPLCCSVYDQENMLGSNFLETPHNELERLKYNHPFCRTCKQYQMDFAPSSVAARP